MFDCLTKTWLVNFKDFTASSIVYFGWELNYLLIELSLNYLLYHQEFCKYSRHIFNEQNYDSSSMENFHYRITERDYSWKAAYAMILANNKKRV